MAGLGGEGARCGVGATGAFGSSGLLGGGANFAAFAGGADVGFGNAEGVGSGRGLGGTGGSSSSLQPSLSSLACVADCTLLAARASRVVLKGPLFSSTLGVEGVRGVSGLGVLSESLAPAFAFISRCLA